MKANSINRLHAMLLGFAGALLLATSLHAHSAIPDPKGDPEAVFTWADDMLDDTLAAVGKTPLEDLFATLEAAIDAHPDYANLYLVMWRTYVIGECIEGKARCGWHDRSSLLRKAVELEPGNARVRVALVHDALNKDCIKCVAPHFEKARQLDASSPYFLEVSARLEEKKGNIDAAIRLYLQSIDAFPTPQKRWFRYLALSRLYKTNHDWQHVGWALEKALEARPESAWSLGNLADHYSETRGDFDKAIPLYRKAIDKMAYRQAIDGLSAALWERWGDAYLKKAPASAQQAYLAEAMSAQPDKEAAFLTSTLYIGTGRAAQALLASKQVPKAMLEQRNSDQRTPLSSAVNNDNRPLALYFVNAGADVNARDNGGYSVTYLAALRGNRPLFDALVAKRADFRASSHGFSPLMAAAMHKDFPEDRVSIAKFLVAKGEALEAVSADGRTALLIAAEEGSPEMVRFLLSKGAKADHPNAEGMNPPAIALLYGNLPALKVFIEMRAGLDSKVLGQFSLAEFAEMNSHREIAEMLRAAGGH
ncbi:MAG: ankyrin repeat domain-containing protein [Usitatibacter sp.]